MKLIDKPFTIEAYGKKSIRINYVKYVFLILFMTSTFTYAEDINSGIQKVIDIANTTIQSEISALKKHYKDDLNILYEDMSRKGQLNGTPMLKMLSELCLDEIEDCEQLIHNTLLHVVNDSGISYSEELASELKYIAKRYLTKEIGNINGYIKQKDKLSPTLEAQLDIKKTELNNKRSNELKKINSEIDLLVISLNNQKKQLKRSDSSSSSWFHKRKDSLIDGFIITIVGGIFLALILRYIFKLPFSKQQNSTDDTVKIANKIEPDKNADSSLISRFQDALSKMPELLKDIASALKDKENEFVREFFVLQNRNVTIGISTKPRLIYFEEDYENLQNKLDILEDYGFIADVRVGTAPIYRMTPEFVKFLLTDIEIT
jgi:hypothetical protein